MLLFVTVILVSLAPACDISLENPGGSKAGAAYSFTVTSSAVPVTITVNVGPDQLQKITVNEKQQSVSITIPNDARGKTLEIIAENNDGCLVSWSETIQ